MAEIEDNERDIAYSRTVKAGKRIYYLDVKRNRNGDLFLALTESKKKVSGSPENPDISFEKHKIFLYSEDLSKFTEALADVIGYIKEHEPEKKADDDAINITNVPETELKKSTDVSDFLDDDQPISLDITDF